MKTAEEWLHDWSFGADTKTDVLNLVKQIQLDAFKAGMTEAAEIARTDRDYPCTCHNKIASARDRKESL